MLTKTLISRALLMHSLRNAAKNAKQPIRNAGHGSWSYRIPPPMPSAKVEMASTAIGAFCWWWIFWHLLTEPEHVYGEFPYVDPSTYTDEELGIPPESWGSFLPK